ncbi:MAG TPA: trypsin-like peptidase domain-containing protein [Kiloniellales bacterium]
MSIPTTPSTAVIGPCWRAARHWLAVAAFFAVVPMPAAAFDPKTLDSVVTVLPTWPGFARNGQTGLPPGTAPEGTAVAIRPGGFLVTALHVVERAVEIIVRLPDGREVPARLVGTDRTTDLALLAVAVDLPVLPAAPDPALGAPVCALGNQFGLGISVTCGVISGLHRSGVGFNPMEDFVQTDAAVNPGASGGALVDPQGRLVGILSAIFTKASDANIGINFAASVALVQRVVDDLMAGGQVRHADLGLRLAGLEPAERVTLAGVRVAALTPGGAAATAGLAEGDLITAIGGHPVRSVNDARAMIALVRPGARVAVTYVRGGSAGTVEITLPP